MVSEDVKPHVSFLSSRGAFEELKKDLPADAEDFVRYFQETFIGMCEADASSQSSLHLRWRPQRNSLRLCMWCVHDRAPRNDPRTTNFLGDWHRRIISILAKRHPNRPMWDFIHFLQGEVPRGLTFTWWSCCGCCL